MFLNIFVVKVDVSSLMGESMSVWVFPGVWVKVVDSMYT